MGNLVYYLHYTLLSCGLSATSVLFGVYLKTYSDASSVEVGVLLMSFPFASIIIKPLFCTLADNHQKHRLALILSLLTLLVGYSPFIIIPFHEEFYTNHGRYSWYILALSSHMGATGLGVAWSLGDALSINSAKRTGSQFGWMRLTGTISWGIFGFMIGLVNEVTLLPKMVPAFIILYSGVAIEIVLLLFWPKDDFKMDDREEDPTLISDENPAEIRSYSRSYSIDATRGSMSGTLRCDANTAQALMNFWSREDLTDGLKGFEETSPAKEDQIEVTDEKRRSKVPVVLLKLLLRDDKRVIKYLLLFTLFGYFMAPINLVYISMSDLAKDRGVNYSLLAGTIITCEAIVETLTFFAVPWFAARVSRTPILAFGFAVITFRFLFYLYFYSTPALPIYLVIVGECCHGISYAIFCTMLNEVTLALADQSRTYMPDVRRMGLLSESRPDNQLQVRREENAANLALRGLLQALFGGFMDGFGNGFGSFTCCFTSEVYSYVRLWQVLGALALGTLVGQALVELSRSSYSERRAPAEPARRCHQQSYKCRT